MRILSKHEMTDNEIIKTVNYCAKIKSIEDCDKCPSKIVCNDADDERLISGVSNLINRLQKENKKKDEMLRAQADTIFLYERVIKDKNAEIERLVDHLSIPSAEEDEDWYTMPQLKTGEEIKSEVIKELKRRLKENISVIHIGDNESMRVVQEVTIDRILKAMEGEALEG